MVPIATDEDVEDPIGEDEQKPSFQFDKYGGDDGVDLNTKL